MVPSVHERFDEMLQRLHVGVLVLARDGSILALNDVAPRLLGVSAEEFRRRGIFDPNWGLVDEDGRQLDTRDGPNGTTFLTGDPVRDVVIGVRAADTRELVWLLVNTDPATDASGSVESIVCTFVDLTSRQQAGALLRRREYQQQVVAEFGQRALRGASLAIVRSDAARHIAEVLDVPYAAVLERAGDGRFQRTGLFGWEPALLGTYTEGSLAGYTVQVDGAVILDDVETETRFEIPRLVREYRIRSGLSVAIPGEAGPQGVVSAHALEVRAFSDDDVAFLRSIANIVGAVVERERAEAEGHASRQRIERLAAQNSAILRQTAESVVIADASGVVTFANGAAQSMLGRDPTGATLDEYAEAFNAYDVKDGMRATAERTALGRALLFGEAVLNARRRVVRPDGSEIVAVGNAVPLIAEDGGLLGAVATYRDVTVEYQMAQQKSDFLSAAAHDLKGPLTAIKGHAQLLLRRARREPMVASERVVADAERIDTTATRMATLITEMLDMTRIELGRPLDLVRRPVDLVALVRDAADECARDDGAGRVRVEKLSDTVIGEWDEQRLRRVAANLISNALKYSADESPVEVTIGSVLAGGSPIAELVVRDSGIGIPAADRDRIFDRFFRAGNVPADVEGTGIGLTGARYIVLQHGGTIQIESEEGTGTTVRVLLPQEAGTVTARSETEIAG
jgi:PAS domain S-box-containing protein